MRTDLCPALDLETSVLRRQEGQKIPSFSGLQSGLIGQFYMSLIAHVAELADAYDSGSYGATRGGSSPLVSTFFGNFS